jgi:hypothetical protein
MPVISGFFIAVSQHFFSRYLPEAALSRQSEREQQPVRMV